MVNRCCVKGCRSDKLKQKADRSLHLYNFPAWKTRFGPQMEDVSRRRRLAWISAVGVTNITFEHIPAHVRVCSLHFHTGKPAYEMMESDPDWAPSLRLGQSDSETDTADSDEEACEYSNSEAGAHSSAVSENLQTEKEQLRDSTQDSDLTQNATCSFRAEICSFWEENRELRQQLDSGNFFADGDDDKVKHFTGLSFVSTFTGLLTDLMPLLSHKEKSLTPFQMLLLTFMRLRLDSPVHLLAHLFLVSPKTVCRTFSETVSHLYSLLKHTITWPDRDSLRRSMSHQFVEAFGNRVAVITECFGTLIEKTHNFKTHDQISLSCKPNHTIKYLIGLTPKGAICFLSQGWGGRVSDKHVALHSGFLEKLVPGDIVLLADRGFDEQKCEGLLCAEVKPPAFAKGKLLLEDRDVGETKKISHLRGHVKMVIGNVCQKYKLLSGIIPVSLVLQCEGEKLTLLDKIVTVCCVFSNLCPSVVV